MSTFKVPLFDGETSIRFDVDMDKILSKARSSSSRVSINLSKMIRTIENEIRINFKVNY